MFTVFQDLDTNVCSLLCATVKGLAKGDCESHSRGKTERMGVQMFQHSVHCQYQTAMTWDLCQKIIKVRLLFLPA